MRSDFDYSYGYEVVMLHRKQGKTRLRPNDCFDKHYTEDEHWDCYHRVTGEFIMRHSKVLSARKKKGRYYSYISFHTYWGLLHETARNRFEVTT